MISPSESLAIAELVIYPPILLANIFLLFRHGIRRQAGWIFLTIFCIIRLIGAGFGIAAAKNPDDVNDIEWSAILGSIGISPLLLAMMGLLMRIIDETSDRVPSAKGEPQTWEKVIRYVPVIGTIFRILNSRASASSRRSKFLQLLAIPATVALILCIIGGVDRTSSTVSDQKQGTSLVKAGLILFVVIYACIFVLTARSASEFHSVPAGEKRVLAAVLFALPLLAVRILWSLLAYFSHSSTFSVTSTKSSDIVVRAMMAILEEFLVVIAFTIVGLMVPPAYAQHFDVESKSVGTQRPSNSLPLDRPGEQQYAPNHAPQKPAEVRGGR